MKLAGIVYLYDIKQDRIAATKDDLAMVNRLYQKGIHSVLATTNWGQGIEVELMHDSDGELMRRKLMHEEELLEKHWKIPGGAPRFLGTHESAWAIINLVLTTIPLDTPQFEVALNIFQQPTKSPPKTTWGIFVHLFKRLRRVSSYSVLHSH